ncbi:MAG: nodulation protein NfeD [Myxococcota bacterium]
MNRWISKGATLLALFGLLLGGMLGGATASAAPGEIFVVTIDGSINPASADYLIGAIAQAEEAKASAVLIELDTPGGLVSSTQDIIQAMLNATVPTIVFVTPRGATATSAGTFITLASNVAAMMPGTSIGAAHPVSAFGGAGGGGGGGAPGGDAEEPSDEEAAQSAAQDVITQKMENYLAAYVESIAKQRNRNVEWAREAVLNSVAVTAEEALELGVIDLIADGREELMAAIEGRETQVDGETQALQVAGLRFVQVEETLLQSIFDFLTDPNLAIVFLVLAAAGIYMEVQSPGMIVPGVVGLVALVMLAFSMQILPFSWVGMMLVLVGLGLLIAELFIVSFGALFVAGIICFLVGGTMVFDRPEASDLSVSFWEVLVPIAAAITVVGAFIVYSLGRSFMSEQTAGVDAMIGLVGKVETAIEPGQFGRGKVWVRGEYWNGTAEEEIEAGEPVEIVSVSGLVLHVRKAKSA